jgi:diguanylate cyclase (GGDEF)-like protein
VDVFGRTGGEEFAALLPGAGPEAARAVAERLRGSFEAARWGALPDERRVTASFGVAPVDARSEPLRQALERSDRALYAAKRGGRNRVCVG